MTKKDVYGALMTIDQYFQLRDKKSEDTTQTQLNVYFQALRDVPTEVALPAMLETLKICRYPSQFLVDWVEQIKRIQESALPSVVDLWNTARKAAKEIGRNSFYAQSGGLVGVKTSAQLRECNRNIFNNLPAEIQFWAGDASGLVAIFDAPQSELTRYIRPQFIKAVKKYRSEHMSRAINAHILDGPQEPTDAIGCATHHPQTEDVT